jgi:hypothetical protein
MSKTILEPIPAALEGVVLPANDKTKQAADARLRFEDEPAHYQGLLRDEADDK